MDFNKVIDFWFNEIDSKQWWVKDLEFDQLVIERFSDVHEQAVMCELYKWREEALGRLAEIIVLDQFSRNMFRDKPEAFASDSLALALAQEAVAQGADRVIRGAGFEPAAEPEDDACLVGGTVQRQPGGVQRVG